VAEWDLAIKPPSNNSAGNRSGYSRSRAFYHDPCPPGGLVVSPCVSGGPAAFYYDPCPPGGLVVSPWISGGPASSKVLLSGLAGFPESAGPNPEGIQPRRSANPPRSAKTPGNPPGDGPGPGNGVTGYEGSATTPVPSPGSVYLLGLGLLLLLRRRPEAQCPLITAPSAVG
jgi:MYXO-CTERM domain-containing protein